MHLDNKLCESTQFPRYPFCFLVRLIFVYFKHEVLKTFIIMPLKHGPIRPNIMLCGQDAPKLSLN